MVVAKYGSQNDWTPSVSRGPYGCGPWKGILKHLPMFTRGFAFDVGDGCCIKF